MSDVKPNLTGRLLNDRYRLLEREHTTVLADVYRAQDEHRDQTVALKILHPALTSRPEIIRRFRAEARDAAALSHPNLCAAQHFGETDDGACFVVLQYARGKTLREVLNAESRLPWMRAVHIARQGCEGLDAAHELEIVHRKVRPGKILLAEGEAYPDFVKILDVGVANVRFADLHLEPQAVDTETVHNAAAYMAPEQAEGRRFEPSSDIYSLGVVLYEMLTGRLPYLAKDPYRTLRLHVTAPLPSFEEVTAEVKVPPALERVVRLALEKRPDDRYETAGELGEALARIN